MTPQRVMYKEICRRSDKCFEHDEFEIKAGEDIQEIGEKRELEHRKEVRTSKKRFGSH